MTDRLGKYELRGSLGKGASGTVHLGWDPHIARKVAIKTVPLPAVVDADTGEQIDRFRREAQAAGRLHHPNVVGIYDYGETADLAYIVMELVDGESLKDVVDRRERFAIPDVLRLMDELLAGLGYSHGAGVVHRDIKPANLMITRDGRLKIADFGIARIENSGLTQVGTIMGTPAYMAPEQISGDPVDARADLYAAGVVLYLLLTGERPFEGSISTIMQKVLTAKPQPPSELSVTAPTALDAVVLRAMAKRPEERFASAAAFASALKAAALDRTGSADEATMLHRPGPAPAGVVGPDPRRPVPIMSPPVGRPAARSGRTLVAALGILALVAAGGGLWWFLRTAAPDRAQLAGGQVHKPVQTAVVSPPKPAQPVPAVAPPAISPNGPAVAEPVVQPAPSAPAVVPAALPPPGSTPAPPATSAFRDPVAILPPPPEPANPVIASAAPPPAGPAIAPPSVANPVIASPSPPPQPSPPAPSPIEGPTTEMAAVVPVKPILPEPAPPLPPPPPRPEPVVAALPALSHSAIAAALSTVTCTLVTASVDDAGSAVHVDALSAQAAADTALRRALAAAAPAAKPAITIRTIPPTTANCRLLDLLRSLAAASGQAGPSMRIALAEPSARLAKGAPIRVDVQMPNYPAELRLDYLSSDGRVAHILPDGAAPMTAAGARIQPGTDGVIGGVAPPYGTDLILVTAASAPLFAKPRAQSEESTTSYLKDLQAAIEGARRRGVQVVGAATVLETAAR